jgi:predicted metalloendopeptidase
MPSREYYLKDAESEHKDAYLHYMVNVAIRLGANETIAKRDMLEVLKFEEQLANVSRISNLAQVI